MGYCVKWQNWIAFINGPHYCESTRPWTFLEEPVYFSSGPHINFKDETVYSPFLLMALCFTPLPFLSLYE